MPKLKPGYPKHTADDTGVRNEYVYFDLTSTLKTTALAYPVNRTYIDGMPISRSALERVELSDYSTLTIETFLPKGQTGIPSGSGGIDGTGVLPPPEKNPSSPLSKQTSAERTVGEVRRGASGVDDEYPYYEIDWTQNEKQLKQHPVFADFTADQFNQLEMWDKETDGAARIAFQFWVRDKDGAVVGSVQTLDSDQQKYARLRLLGVEAFLDFAPIARKTSRFSGNTTPETSDAGQKSGSDPFTDVPEGYEWLKIGDRSAKQGEGSDWMRVEEWQGARKILLDKDELFLD